ncbi:lysozyme [Tahibacter amnicola]|uniref:lysozyme n=1 Tax=Tahibacter amnicola TaxID=2976241 RepID=UPI003CCCD435
MLVRLSPNPFDALVSFRYNVGSGALRRSTLRQKRLRGDYAAVPRELQRWVWAKGKRLRGLEKRRATEAALFLGVPVSQGNFSAGKRAA